MFLKTSEFFKIKFKQFQANYFQKRNTKNGQKSRNQIHSSKVF